MIVKNRNQVSKESAIWSKGHEIVLQCYTYTRRFPPDEQNGLTWQIRNNARSVMGHMLKGVASLVAKSSIEHLNQSLQELEELRYSIELSEHLGFGKSQDLAKGLIEMELLLKDTINKSYNNLSLNL